MTKEQAQQLHDNLQGKAKYYLEIMNTTSNNDTYNESQARRRSLLDVASSIRQVFLDDV